MNIVSSLDLFHFSCLLTSFQAALLASPIKLTPKPINLIKNMRVPYKCTTKIEKEVTKCLN